MPDRDEPPEMDVTHRTAGDGNAWGAFVLIGMASFAAGLLIAYIAG